MVKEKKEIAYDPEATTEYIKRLFEIERELKILREDKKELNQEFKKRIDQKLIQKIIRSVRISLDLQDLKASKETIEEIELLVKDKIAAII